MVLVIILSIVIIAIIFIINIIITINCLVVAMSYVVLILMVIIIWNIFRLSELMIIFVAAIKSLPFSCWWSSWACWYSGKIDQLCDNSFFISSGTNVMEVNDDCDTIDDIYIYIYPLVLIFFLVLKVTENDSDKKFPAVSPMWEKRTRMVPCLTPCLRWKTSLSSLSYIFGIHQYTPCKNAFRTPELLFINGLTQSNSIK